MVWAQKEGKHFSITLHINYLSLVNFTQRTISNGVFFIVKVVKAKDLKDGKLHSRGRNSPLQGCPFLRMRSPAKPKRGLGLPREIKHFVPNPNQNSLREKEK